MAQNHRLNSLRPYRTRISLVPPDYPRSYLISAHILVYRCKRLSRTVSARIPTELHEELRERCNLIGESINDFVKAAIELALHNSAEFDFGDELLEELDEKRNKKL